MSDNPFGWVTPAEETTPEATVSEETTQDAPVGFGELPTFTETVAPETAQKVLPLAAKYLAAREEEAQAKAVAAEARKKIAPLSAATKKATGEVSRLRDEIVGNLAQGETIEGGGYRVTLSNPAEKFERVVNVDRLLTYLEAESPELVAKYTETVDKTPTPALTVKKID